MYETQLLAISPPVCHPQCGLVFSGKCSLWSPNGSHGSGYLWLGAEQRISRYIRDVPSLATRRHSRVGLPAPKYFVFSDFWLGGRGLGWGVGCGRYSWLKKKNPFVPLNYASCHFIKQRLPRYLLPGS